MSLSRNVLETRVFQPAFEKRSRARLHAAFSRGFEKCGVEVFRSEVWCERTVWRVPFQVEIDAFDPATWFGMSSETSISGFFCLIVFLP